MEERIFCQSCGMPMEKEEDFGTERDGGKSPDYCTYCYQQGAFTADITMEEMIDFNLRFNENNGFPLGTQEEARRGMLEYMPKMKRWNR